MFKVLSQLNKSPKKSQKVSLSNAVFEGNRDTKSSLCASVYYQSKLTHLFYIPPSSKHIYFLLKSKNLLKNFGLGNRHIKL